MPKIHSRKDITEPAPYYVLDLEHDEYKMNPREAMELLKEALDAVPVFSQDDPNWKILENIYQALNP